MTGSSVHWIGGMPGARLGIQPAPMGDLLLDGEVAAWRGEGITLVVSLLEPAEVAELGLGEEEELCRTAGIRFISFPVPDRGVPGSMAGAAALAGAIAEEARRGAAVVHCYGGIGRSSLIAGCAMIGLGVPEDEVFDAIGRARGHQVPQTAEQEEWLAHFARGKT